MEQTIHLPVHTDDGTKIFWENAKPPADFEMIMENVRGFVQKQIVANRPIALVTVCINACII